MAVIPKKTPMPTQDAKVRAHNFSEVATGYTVEMAVGEAARCLNCKNKPCVSGCPVNIDIPGFISKIKDGDFEGAYRTISVYSSLPAVCGRVCPQESQCESKCTLGIKFEPVGIGRLERFVADMHNASGSGKTVRPAPNGHKVAVVGSGPSGLTCAGDLAKKGYSVSVFEALHTAGGVLVYGIPEFRLPNSVVDAELDNLRALGVKFHTNTVIGKTLSYDDLLNMGFRGIFVASGAGLPRFMGIPGENLSGVMSSNEYLTRINLMGAGRPGSATPVLKGRRVAVIGGGNTAMDSVRTARRMGAERAMIIYRRGLEEMPARVEEVHHAREEGVEFLTLCNPVRYEGDESGRVCRMYVQRMELGEPDASGRRSPVPVDGAVDEIEVDQVIVSVGVSPNPLIPDNIAGLNVTPRGTVAVDGNHCSSIPTIYAGGDIVRGGATVILAMGDGRQAAASMAEKLLENA